MAVSVDKLPSDIPSEITPERIIAWCDALDINRSDAAAMIGKAPNFWGRLTAGEVDLKLNQLNTLLRMFRFRAEALRQS
jgi:predicted transcriptional regulator